MKNTNQSPITRLNSHLTDLKGKIRTAIFYSVLNKVFDLAPPLLIGMAVEIVVNREHSFFRIFGEISAMTQLIWVAILTFVIWGLESLFEFMMNLKWRTLAQEIQHRLRLETYGHLQKLELGYFEDQSTGNLISIVNDDVNQLERFLDNGASELIQVATTVIVIGAIFFTLSPMVAAFSFLPIPLILWGSFLFQRKIEPRYASVRKEVGILSGLLANNFGGIATIKSYSAEDFEQNRLMAQSEAYANANNKAIRLSASFSPLIRMVVLCGFVAALILGGHLALTGALAVGSYSVMVFMTQRLLWPLTRLGATVDLYQRAMASTRRIFGLLDTPIEIHDGEKELDIKTFKGQVTFENVNFSYKNGANVLHDISFDVKEGKTIGLVGPTGSGKTTLLKLLLRFYDVSSGKVLVDGTDIRDLKQKNLRDLIAYVGQDSYLFHGTVLENVTYGSFNKSMEEIEEALKFASAWDFVNRLPQGVHTVVGERGQKLSGGQKQRLSIARAVLKNAPIFLFDEATSAVDNETEVLIQKALDKITKEKTTFIVAHRLSTIRHADIIYVVENGRVVEKGAHDELLNNRGLYSKLWLVQTGEKGEFPAQ